MITVTTQAQKAEVLDTFLGHANHHLPQITDTVRRLGLAVFGAPGHAKIKAATKCGDIARSAWAEINGRWRYFCLDHSTNSIAMKDKKGGKILAYFDNNVSDAELLRRLAL